MATNKAHVFRRVVDWRSGPDAHLEIAEPNVQLSLWELQLMVAHPMLEKQLVGRRHPVGKDQGEDEGLRGHVSGLL